VCATTVASAAGNIAKLTCKGVRWDASPDLLCGLNSTDADGAAVAVNVNGLCCDASPVPGVVRLRLEVNRSPRGTRLQAAGGVQEAVPGSRRDASPALNEAGWNEVTGVLLIEHAEVGGPTGHGGTQWLPTAVPTPAGFKDVLGNGGGGGGGGSDMIAGIDGGG